MLVTKGFVRICLSSMARMAVAAVSEISERDVDITKAENKRAENDYIFSLN